MRKNLFTPQTREKLILSKDERGHTDHVSTKVETHETILTTPMKAIDIIPKPIRECRTDTQEKQMSWVIVKNSLTDFTEQLEPMH